MNVDFSPLWISLKTALTASAIAFFLGIAAARWMFDYRGKSKALLDTLLTSPLVLPPTVVGFFLLLLLGKNGPIGQILGHFGVTLLFSWYATAIAATVVAFPLMYKTALAAFQQIDPHLLASARTLGACETTVFWRVLLPLSAPGLIAGSLLSFARALGEFGATLMVAGSIPGKTQTIPIAIYFAAESGAMDVALIWVLAILTISLGAILAMNFWTDSGNSNSFRHSKFITWRRRIKNSLILKSARLRRFFSIALAITQRQKSDFHFKVPLKKRNLWRSLFKSLAPAPLCSPLVFPLETKNSAIQLTVEIQKQLPNFYLNVSFTTGSEPLGILGASGAGKSTILRCIAGLETPDRGRIVLNGRVLFDSESKINLPSRDRRVGVLFQDYALFPHLTAAENIAFGLPKGLSRLAIKQRVEAQLAAIQLQGMGERYPRQLSGGQQQRIALARALASEPEILLFDEPLSALDTHLRYQIEKLLAARLAHYRGATLFVTHNLEEAYRLCPKLAVIERGYLVRQALKQSIFTHPRTLSIAQLTGCKNFSRTVTVAPHRVSALDWGCTLEVAEPIPQTLSHLGLRAHQLIFTDVPSSENTFPCWLTATSETPHRMTLFLKFNSPPTSPHDYHLQAEVFKEKWAMLQNLPFPWFVQLHPERLLLLSEGERGGDVQNSDREVEYSV